jgi:hypothetical protein
VIKGRGTPTIGAMIALLRLQRRGKHSIDLGLSASRGETCCRMLDKHEHFAGSHFTARKAASVFENSNDETERFFFTCAAASITHHFLSASHAEFHQGYGERT